jgi:lysophospholipase
MGTMDATKESLTQDSGAEPAVVEESALFTGDGSRLHRRGVVPGAAAPPAWAQLAIVHGYGDHSGRYLPSMRWLAQRGIACHAVDLRGQGASAGRRAFVDRWDDYLRDVQSFLGQGFWREDLPRFLLGHSHGALVLTAAVIWKTPGVASVAGCIFTSPFYRSVMPVPLYKMVLARMIAPWMPALMVRSGVRREWLSRDPEVLAAESRDLLLVPYATPRWYVAHQRIQEEVMRRAGEFRLPLLVLAGTGDPIADIAQAASFCQKAGSSDKQYRAYGGMMHELLRDLGRERVLEEILFWVRGRVKS